MLSFSRFAPAVSNYVGTASSTGGGGGVESVVDLIK